MNRLLTRLAFGLAGAFGCLLCALAMEPMFHRLRIGDWIDDHVTRVVLFRSDFSRRLDLAGAHQGDVQISLAWNNHNDLDLWCYEPSGYRIFYSHRVSPSGGMLDVDRNASQPYDDQPVEHIYWPRGRAPAGRYIVKVDHYASHGGADPTVFTVQVLDHGRVRTFHGEISQDDQPILVDEFTVGAGGDLPLAARPEFWRAIAIVCLWTALLGVVLAAALIAAQELYAGANGLEPLLTWRKRGEALLVGLAAGIVAGAVGQAVFGFAAQDQPWQILVAFRVGCCASMGAALGFLISLRMPNLPPLSALLGGAAGGCLLALGYIVAADINSDPAGRVIGATALGFAIGAMIRLYAERIIPEPVEKILLPTLRTNLLRPQSRRPEGTLRG